MSTQITIIRKYEELYHVIISHHGQFNSCDTLQNMYIFVNQSLSLSFFVFYILCLCMFILSVYICVYVRLLQSRLEKEEFEEELKDLQEKVSTMKQQLPDPKQTQTVSQVHTVHSHLLMNVK